MSNVEERLATVEREVEQLLVRQHIWPMAEIDEKYKGDSVLEEIFRLAKEERNNEVEVLKE